MRVHGGKKGSSLGAIKRKVHTVMGGDGDSLHVFMVHVEPDGRLDRRRERDHRRHAYVYTSLAFFLALFRVLFYYSFSFQRCMRYQGVNTWMPFHFLLFLFPVFYVQHDQKAVEGIACMYSRCISNRRVTMIDDVSGITEDIIVGPDMQCRGCASHQKSMHDLLESYGCFVGSEGDRACR